jgi:four helix bundle protein
MSDPTGTKCAVCFDVRATCVEELLVYQKSLALADEVSVMLARPSLASDRKLHDRLGASSERIPSVIAEGFAQKTDRHFASYLYHARGSSKETRTHLHVACTRGHVTTKERDDLQARYNEVEKMLTGLIKHLNREDRRQRG